MVDRLKGEIRQVNSFLLVMNGASSRLDENLKAMLKLFTGIFSNRMWRNTLVIVTHWPYDDKSLKNRQSTGKNESERVASTTKYLQE